MSGFTNKKNTLVRVPKQPQIRVCKTFALNLPMGVQSKSTRGLKAYFNVENASELFRKCAVKLPFPEKVIAEGGFGRVFRLRNSDIVAKFQVFAMNNIDEQSSEFFLNHLFSLNGISPTVRGSVFFQTSNPNLGGSMLALDFHPTASQVLKNVDKGVRVKLANIMAPQIIVHLNKMLSLGFACIDLKPSNILFNVLKRRTYMIDFSSSLCQHAPFVLDRFAHGSRNNEIISDLPGDIRRDVIATQLIFLHVTFFEFRRTVLYEKIVEQLIGEKDRATLVTVYSFLIKAHVPLIFKRYTRSRTVNRALFGFLSRFARGGSRNFLHYTDKNDEMTFEEFVAFIRRGHYKSVNSPRKN